MPRGLMIYYLCGAFEETKRGAFGVAFGEAGIAIIPRRGDGGHFRGYVERHFERHLDGSIWGGKCPGSFGGPNNQTAHYSGFFLCTKCTTYRPGIGHNILYAYPPGTS